METMSGLNRMFVNVESDRFPVDFVGIFLLDPSTAPGGHDYQRVRAELAARIPTIPVFTRRCVAAPFGAGHQQWVTEPNFSIDRHLKHLGAPAPYDLSALCELTVSLLDEPLKRDRPLWEMYYVDGLADGSAAILFRMHHACIDGVGLTEVLAELFDSEPLAADPHLTAANVVGERVPSQSEMLVRSLPDQLLTPARLAYRGVPVAWAVGRSLLARVVSSSHGPDPDHTAVKGGGSDTAPSQADRTARSLFNRAVKSPKRSVAVTSVPIADIKQIQKRFGVTFNDVVLAVTSAAVADYLRGRDDLPAQPLRVASPVNIRDGAAESAGGNYFTLMMVPIPSDVADPVQRLKAIAAMAGRNKPARTGENLTRRQATGAVVNSVARLIDVIPGTAWAGLAHLLNSSSAEAVPTVANYLVSNVPGPKRKLYVAGAELTHVYGRAMVGIGIGLLIHCISYADTLDFGFTALAELVPDPDKIARGVHHHLSALLAAGDPDDQLSASRSRGCRRKTVAADVPPTPITESAV
jgi:diacylglycerol O-acyltransferase